MERFEEQNLKISKLEADIRKSEVEINELVEIAKESMAEVSQQAGDGPALC